MLTSIKLLGRLEANVDRRQLLVEQHIVAAEPAEMRMIDEKLAATDRMVSAAMRVYGPWANLDGEKETWKRTRRDLATLDAPIARALDLSRRNADAAARRAMESVDAQFEQVDRDLDELIEINDRAANGSLAQYADTRTRLLLTVLGVGLVSFALSVIVGVWAWLQVARREEQMMIAAKGLAARNRDLDAFAGRVAHDIRGVLASMTLAIGATATRLPDDDRSMQVLRRGATRMDALVSDLLALARAGTARHGRSDPQSIIEQVARDVAQHLDSQSGSIRVAAEHARVACEEGLLRQAVMNLVDNAIKYHRPDAPPKVTISGTTRDDGYELRVQDNGLGMSSEEAEHVFEPFYRSPNVHELPGTGLGLSIVSRIAEAVGGRLSVESRLGEGSTFAIRLPLAKTPEIEGERRSV
jgi:signal transduction histidine kinase